MTLGWQLIGGEAQFLDSPMFGFGRKWLRARLANLEKTTGTTERAGAIRAGAYLDRRAFLRLIAEAENSAKRQVAGPEG
jgi:hypothetical protein